MSRGGADWLGLEGTTVVITGAVGGIGVRLAESFVSVGASVALLDRSRKDVDALAEKLRAGGATAVGVACDVSDEASVAAAAEQVAERIGPAGVLVNNAAVLQSGLATTIPLAEWNWLIGINLTGYMLCAREFTSQMKSLGGGALVHTASIGGHMPQGYAGAYSVAKAGVRMLSQVLAIELGAFGIRSNVVSPAMLVTPLSEAFYQDPAMRAAREAMAPVGRIGTPQDIADAVLWLASDRAGYVSGEEILVDGALSKNQLATLPRPGFDKSDALERR
jgi:NAD(P)-dependent dehydrogenase (short-subunit alcohol dehydrogenase family)